MPWKTSSKVGFGNYSRLLFLSLFFLVIFGAPLYAYDRIISLKPNLTEILFALGVGDKIVGVTTFCDYPPEAKKIDKVSDYLQPDIEKLIAKKPDLIITSEENSQRREIEYLMRKGYKVLTYKTDTLTQLRETMASLGKEVGRPQASENLLKSFDAQMTELQKKVENLRIKNPTWKAPKALFVVGQHPLIVAGSGNLMNDIAPYVGLQNAVLESRLKYPTFSLEQIYAVAPEYILDFAMGTEASEAGRQESRKEWENMKAIPAIRNHHLYFWDIGALRASPRLPAELLRLFEALYPSSVVEKKS